MATILQCIDEFIDNISVTDRQEENIEGSVKNLTECITKKDSDLNIKEVFVNGSYERDTIIRPLDDIDLFVVFDPEKYLDAFRNKPNPQAVLTKIKNYLDKANDYKDKVFQDRPCITVELSNKKFDLIPSFPAGEDVYWIPSRDLLGWDLTNPVTHSKRLDEINIKRNYLVKKVVKAVKKWKRDMELNLPSYHIEEVAMSLFNFQEITNIKMAIEKWFQFAPTAGYLSASKFKSYEEYEKTLKKINGTYGLFEKATLQLLTKRENEAILIWKSIFGSDFPTTTEEEAKSFSKSMLEGSLKISPSGIINQTAGKTVPQSTGFFGEK